MMLFEGTLDLTLVHRLYVIDIPSEFSSFQFLALFDGIYNWVLVIELIHAVRQTLLKIALQILAWCTLRMLVLLILDLWNQSFALVMNDLEYMERHFLLLFLSLLYDINRCAII